MKHFGVITLLVFFLIVLGIVAINTKKPQQVREKAATPAGTEQIMLSPASSSVASGSKASISLSALFSDTQLDGIQVIATFSGTLPTDLTFTPNAIPGMQIIRNKMTSTGRVKRLELVFVTDDPTVPYHGTITQQLGTLTFTAPASGSLMVAYNTTLTKISENATAADILGMPKEGTYAFVSPTPTPYTYCSGSDGSLCELTTCPTCTGRLCPKIKCIVSRGVCKNHACVIR